MTQPGIEPWSTGPMANSLPTRKRSNCLNIFQRAKNTSQFIHVSTQQRDDDKIYKFAKSRVFA